MRSQTVTTNLAIPAERIERRILLVRGQKVMLDSDLASLYGVKQKCLTKPLNATLTAFLTISCSSLRQKNSKV